MISLTLFLIIVIAFFEVLGLARGLFIKLKKAEEDTQAAMAALDKMRIDLLRAGSGLTQAIRLGIAKGIERNEEGLVIFSLEETRFPSEDLFPGTQRIILDSTAGTSPGREICLMAGYLGEHRSIVACEGKSILLDSPLEFSYPKNETQLLLLEKISLFLDKARSTIRRRVNSSSAQPLLDEVHSFSFDFKTEDNLVRVNFALKADEERIYEILVFPKNTAICSKPS